MVREARRNYVNTESDYMAASDGSPVLTTDYSKYYIAFEASEETSITSGYGSSVSFEEGDLTCKIAVSTNTVDYAMESILEEEPLSFYDIPEPEIVTGTIETNEKEVVFALKTSSGYDTYYDKNFLYETVCGSFDVNNEYSVMLTAKREFEGSGMDEIPEIWTEEEAKKIITDLITRVHVVPGIQEES